MTEYTIDVSFTTNEPLTIAQVVQFWQRGDTIQFWQRGDTFGHTYRWKVTRAVYGMPISMTRMVERVTDEIMEVTEQRARVFQLSATQQEEDEK